MEIWSSTWLKCSVHQTCTNPYTPSSGLGGQFWPRHARKAASKRYSGHIKLKYMVMACQFRAKHVDSHYASVIWRYQKEFCIRYANYTKLLCQDDKHVIKIGEPGPHGHRSDMRSGWPWLHENVIKIYQRKIEESFYMGQVYVGFKENCFQSSTCLRHLTEFPIANNDDS